MQTYSCLNVLFLMNKTKDQISSVWSHDLYWENKMYKRKRSIDSKGLPLYPLYTFLSASLNTDSRPDNHIPKSDAVSSNIMSKLHQNVLFLTWYELLYCYCSHATAKVLLLLLLLTVLLLLTKLRVYSTVHYLQYLQYLNI